MDRDLVRISKFLSLVLRHEPGHAAGAMQGDGHLFFLSANGVWLTEAVPPAYLEFP